MNGKQLLLILIGIICACGAVGCVVMLICAVRFQEWGRVVLYAVCSAVCVEAAVLSFGQMKKE